MNSIWNNNISAFSKRFPQLCNIHAKEIALITEQCNSGASAQAVCFDSFQTATAKNGEITACENRIALHSSYNPGREAQNAVTNSTAAQKDTTVFYGTGLGYHIFEFTRQLPQKKLIIIEPDALRFFRTLTVLDWTKVFLHKELIIILACPPDLAFSLLEDSSKINIGNSGVSATCFFEIPAFTNHAKEYFEAIKTIVKRNLQKNEINAATLKKFGKLWIRNSLKNMNKMMELNGINSIKTVQDNQIPYVIIGAGPGLQKLIPYLQEIKKRSVFICVETALHTLLRNGIQPDFIVLLDSQYWAYKHIAGLSSPQSVLVTDITAFPAVFRFKCKKILLCDSQFPAGQHFQTQLNINYGNLGTGGSVACSAWNLANYLHATEIYFAGVDLSFPGKQTHIKGSSAEQTFHTVSTRNHSAEQYGIASLFSANATYAQDYNGNPVITDSRMKMFAWWFESKIAETKTSRTYTLCPDTLKIPGVTPVKIEDFLKKSELQTPAFLLPESSPELSAKQQELFHNLKENFPTPDFLEQYSFLKDYF